VTANGDTAGDLLFLEGLEVPCRVGCTEPERATPQSLRVDMRLYCASLRDAAIADDLERTVDYRLAGDLIDAVQGREYLLIERVAEELAQVALRNPLVDRVTVSVRKRPPVQGLEWAGVQITRGR
jgi:7,8-dihydroneopterin aldolase/epimerase/oxygenase